ncbi:MAG: hypothetical protein COV29_02240 [Candidatus Yanofskybacteria bacterium CG10_big_fil_rev_8_21_14_0_10_36_16]|uniref:Glycosyltransferase RgtA/B/C/D-like domain-containing protein n=1 Tax=Candidatus Yanofskybacteria bacterium CG10_big_fil_rev_8_21_14_0_10_36_16 TaxID=1975096 RepID=A0A2J0Q7L5_9BACT|nr:MAG: hypothetical protein COV29_02240 [Candidatus Yanofskybacteria bacterium CG10_big_fil_rev_8_21_14_0_10_36_16]
MKTRNYELKIVFLLIAIGFVVFGNSLGGDFVYDDHLILSHSFMGDWGNLASFFNGPYFEDFGESGLYRPLTQVSLSLNFLLFGNGSFSFHIINVLLHTVNSFLVFLLIQKISKRQKFSLISSIIFLVLPIHVEAVSSIVGRAELLTFLFSLFSVLILLDKPTVKWSLVSAGCFFLALLSKETAVALFPVVLIIIFVYTDVYTSLYTKVAHASYFLIAILGYFLLRINALGMHAFGVQPEFVFNPLAYVSAGERVLTAFKILPLYLQKILIPFGLSPDYSFNQIKNVSEINFLSIVGIIVLFGLIFWAIKKINNIFWVLGISLFIFPYLLISNLLFPVGTIMGDRLMYLPSVGLIILLAFLPDKKKYKRALIGLVAVYSVLCINQNKIWANETTLYKAMYERSSDSVVAKTNWAKTLVLEGQTSEARELLLEANSQYEYFLLTLTWLGSIEANESNFEKAEEYFEKALLLRPNNQNVLTSLSRVYFKQRKYHQANRILESLVLNYSGEGNKILYVISQIRAHNYQKAINVITKYYGDNPTDESARVLFAYANYKIGNFALANKTGFSFKEAEDNFLNLESFFW